MREGLGCCECACVHLFVWGSEGLCGAAREGRGEDGGLEGSRGGFMKIFESPR